MMASRTEIWLTCPNQAELAWLIRERVPTAAIVHPAPVMVATAGLFLAFGAATLFVVAGAIWGGVAGALRVSTAGEVQAERPPPIRTTYRVQAVAVDSLTITAVAGGPRDPSGFLRRQSEIAGRFLGLVGLAALLLGGLGVASAINVFIKSRRDTIAVLRCLGATQRTAFTAYLLQAIALGIGGAAAGVLLGLAIQIALPSLLQNVLPFDVDFRIEWPVLATGLAIGTAVTTVFALLPLLDIRGITPLRALRHALEPARAVEWRKGCDQPQPRSPCPSPASPIQSRKRGECRFDQGGCWMV